MMFKPSSLQGALLTAIITAQFCGCSAVKTYVHQRFKVGPNYQRPEAATEVKWIDDQDKRLNTAPCPDISRWWKVFGDQTLDALVQNAYEQNLTLKEAGFRILESRALLGISIGEIFPQQQSLNGAYTRSANSVDPGLFPPKRYFDNWNWRFNLAWELDFWGRFRRAVIAAQDELDASVADYDQVLVTLLGDVSANYVQARVLQNQIKIFQANVEIQRGVLAYIEKRYKAGFRTTELDYDQALSNLKQTEAAIPQLEVSLRNATNRLCVLLGMPPEDLTKIIGTGPIPVAPVDAAVGMPAELLRRRPDVRRAERLAAAQSEQIGIAISDFYPAFSINGSLGMNARNFSSLYSSTAFTGSVGPSFNWRLLEYGRLLNNVRYQDARFQELITAYRQSVLTASEEAENGIVQFLRAQERSKLLDDSTEAAERAVRIVILQYQKGAVDFNRYAVIQQNLITQQNAAVTAHGEIAQGLIQIYRALGGGWEIRLTGGPSGPEGEKPAVKPEAPNEPESLPAPEPLDIEREDGIITVLPPIVGVPKPAERDAVDKAPADLSDVFVPEEPVETEDKNAPPDVPEKAAPEAAEPPPSDETPDPSAEDASPADEQAAPEPMKIQSLPVEPIESAPVRPKKAGVTKQSAPDESPQSAMSVIFEQDWPPRVDGTKKTKISLRTKKEREPVEP